MILNCIGVDDEKLALDLLENNISQVPFLKLVARCKNAYEAMGVMQQQHVDLIFLDAQMPGIHGLKFAENVKGKVGVIFLTAHAEYALEGFSVNAIDYLLKPVDFDRFLQSCMKAFEILKPSRNASGTQNYSGTDLLQGFIYSNATEEQSLFVHVDYNLVKINLCDILYMEGYKDYVKIYSAKTNSPIITRISMKLLDEKLASHGFVRIHKSYIVPFRRITAVQRGIIVLDTQELPISEGYKENLLSCIQRKNVL